MTFAIAVNLFRQSLVLGLFVVADIHAVLVDVEFGEERKRLDRSPLAPLLIDEVRRVSVPQFRLKKWEKVKKEAKRKKSEMLFQEWRFWFSEKSNKRSFD